MRAALALGAVLWVASAVAHGAPPDMPAPTGPASADACAIPADVWPPHHAGYCLLPAEVRAFVARNDTCGHFLGEASYDAERRRELEAAVGRYCKGARRRFDALMARYHGDPATRDWLRR